MLEVLGGSMPEVLGGLAYAWGSLTSQSTAVKRVMSHTQII